MEEKTSPPVKDVMLEVELPYGLNYNHHLVLGGNWEQFGSLVMEKGIRLRWMNGNIWKVRFHIQDIPRFFSEELEFKFGVLGSQWEKQSRKISFRLEDNEVLD